MRKEIIVALCGILIFGCLLLQAARSQATEGTPPPEGGTFPDISLPLPENPDELLYLGLSGGKSFKLPMVRADVVIIEIFSMYCPFCQKEAPSVNELYRIIDQDAALKNRIKIIGLGVGNTPFEVNTFKRTYAIPFPMLPDADFALYEVLGKTRTPCFIVVKMDKDGGTKVIYSKQGTIGDPKSFLESIVKESGLQKGK